MNKSEQQLWRELSDEEKEKVAAGASIDEGTELTTSQCQRLQKCRLPRWEPLSPMPMLVKYGGPPIMAPVVTQGEPTNEPPVKQPIPKDTEDTK